MKPIKIILTDDHQIVIDGLKAVLETAPDIQIIGAALNGKVLLQLLQTLTPDLILLDISMPIMDGLETAAKVKEQYPQVKILILTTHASPHKIKQILKLGVEGYILKDTGRAGLLNAIHTIMQGQTYVDLRVTESLVQSYQPQQKPLGHLTKREKEITQLIAQGKSTKEVAQALFISPLTVETHRKNIFSKLGIHKTAELVKYAIREGLIN